MPRGHLFCALRSDRPKQLRINRLRCCRTDARNAAVGSCPAGEPNWTGTPARLWGQQIACGLMAIPSKWAQLPASCYLGFAQDPSNEAGTRMPPGHRTLTPDASGRILDRLTGLEQMIPPGLSTKLSGRVEALALRLIQIGDRVERAVEDRARMLGGADQARGLAPEPEGVRLLGMQAIRAVGVRRQTRRLSSRPRWRVARDQHRDDREGVSSHRGSP